MKTAIRTMWACFEDFLDTHQKRARFALRDLRRTLRDELQSLGEKSARLERLDAALQQATVDKAEALYQRIHYHCEQRFGEMIRTSFKKESGGLEEAFAPEGWIYDHMSHCCDLIYASVRMESDRIDALVERCIELYDAENGVTSKTSAGTKPISDEDPDLSPGIQPEPEPYQAPSPEEDLPQEP